jgi:hypothetical protein
VWKAVPSAAKLCSVFEKSIFGLSQRVKELVFQGFLGCLRAWNLRGVL